MFFAVHLIIYTAKRVGDNNNRTMLMQSSFAFRGDYVPTPAAKNENPPIIDRQLPPPSSQNVLVYFSVFLQKRYDGKPFFF
jgi:hypothetical protein